MDDDRAEIEKLRHDWVNKRWDKERGIQTIDYNNTVVLVRAPVEAVCQALAYDAVAWEREALGREISLGRYGCFIFRLRGHEWTEVVDYWESSIKRVLGPDWERTLSKKLRTRVISYTVSDTSGWTGYSLWDNGELLEDFSAMEAGSEEDDEAGRPDPKESTFSSKLRDTTISDIHNIWGFTNDFLIEKDAFDPGIDFCYFLGRREPESAPKIRVQNPGFVMILPWDEKATSTPDIERVDYMAFRPPKP